LINFSFFHLLWMHFLFYFLLPVTWRVLLFFTTKRFFRPWPLDSSASRAAVIPGLVIPLSSSFPSIFLVCPRAQLVFFPLPPPVLELVRAVRFYPRFQSARSSPSPFPPLTLSSSTSSTTVPPRFFLFPFSSDFHPLALIDSLRGGPLTNPPASLTPFVIFFRRRFEPFYHFPLSPLYDFC